MVQWDAGQLGAGGNKEEAEWRNRNKDSLKTVENRENGLKEGIKTAMLQEQKCWVFVMELLAFQYMLLH